METRFHGAIAKQINVITDVVREAASLQENPFLCNGGNLAWMSQYETLHGGFYFSCARHASRWLHPKFSVVVLPAQHMVLPSSATELMFYTANCSTSVGTSTPQRPWQLPELQGSVTAGLGNCAAGAGGLDPNASALPRETGDMGPWVTDTLFSFPQM